MRFANLDEIVMATFYDDAEETWDVKACTVEDVLCSVCEEYTEYEAEPCTESQRESVQEERKTGKWILSDVQQREDIENGNYQYFCSNCLYSDIHAKTVTVPFCWHCGAKMEDAS